MGERRCICDDGFGMNLSCPLHAPHGKWFAASAVRAPEPLIQDVPDAERRAVADSRLRRGVCVLCGDFSDGHVLCELCTFAMLDAVRKRKPPRPPDGSVSSIDGAA